MTSDRSVNCPECGATLRFKQAPAAGKKVRCPKCGQVFRVPEEDDADPAPPRAGRARATAGGPGRRATKGAAATRNKMFLVAGLVGGGALLLLLAAAAVGAFVWMGRTQAPVVGQPQSGGPDVAGQSAINPRDAAWVQALKDPSPQKRTEACQLMGLHRADPHFVVAPLTGALGDPDPGVRGMAAWALGRFGADSRAAVPALGPLVADPDEHVAGRAIEALGAIGPDAKEAVPALRAIASNVDSRLRNDAQGALAKIDPAGAASSAAAADDPAAKALEEIRSNNPRRRDLAVLELGKMKPDDRRRAEVLAALQQLMDADNAMDKNLVADALAVWGGDRAGALVLALLPPANQSMPRGLVADHVIRILGDLRYAPASATLASYVGTLWNDSARDALKSIGPAAEKDVLPLLRGDHGEMLGVRLQAANILRSIGTEASLAPLEQLRTEAGILDRNSEAGIAAAEIRARLGRPR